MKYVIYLRVSIDKQVESGLGIEAQRHDCLSYIKKNGGEEFVEFLDGGYSGSMGIDKRPGLMAALCALNKGDILLVAKRDRIGRDSQINYLIEREIYKRKARLVSAAGDVTDAKDSSSVLMKDIFDAFSKFERTIIGERTKAALRRKIEKKERTGYIPYGFRLSEDGIHVEECPKEQDVLNQIRELRDQNLLFKQIAAVLNKRGYRNRMGNEWNYVNVFRCKK